MIVKFLTLDKGREVVTVGIWHMQDVPRVGEWVRIGDTDWIVRDVTWDPARQRVSISLRKEQPNE